MRAILLTLSLTLLTTVLLQGCAPVVVGGAAAGASVVHDRRSAGTTLDDRTIELKILNKLTQDKRLSDHSSISVNSYNHVVLLSGQAETAEYRKQAAAAAAGTAMVKRVVNEIQVAPSSSISEDAKDSWITSKAKLELFEIKLPGFDPTRVKITTQRGVVYLMGRVTQQEADAAVEKIRFLRGVKQVVKVFEYI
ncbi:MAG: BON domain-containing protein [Candidatus Sedimenticola sp. (ex Thyasira tokunagai)]